MKKIIILFAVIFISLTAFAQKPSAFTEVTTTPDSTWQLYIWDGTNGHNLNRIKIKSYFGDANLQEFRILNGALVKTAEWNKLVGIRLDSTVQEQIDATVSVSDTSSMLSKYLLKTDVDLSASDTADMLTPYINRADTASMLTPYITESESDAAYLSSVGATNIATIVTLQADTVPLVTFGIGGGLAADTACFNNDAVIGAFYNEGSDTLVITQLYAVLKAGTGTETIGVQIAWDANLLDGTPTKLNTTDFTVTSLTAGDADTSFNNAEIPPNVWVWGILSGASKDNKPTFLNVTLSGHKRNLKY